MHPSARVWSSNGQHRALRLCRDFCLQLTKIDVVVDSFFFPWKLGASDIVLGFQWLANLGVLFMNWGNLSLQVSLEGVRVSPAVEQKAKYIC